jgi:hypothetical protein
MRDRVASPSNWPSAFFRAPFIAWEAPQAIRSDMHGPGLGALMIDLLTGGSGKTNVLLPDSVDQATGQLIVSQAKRSDAVTKLLGK